MNEGSAEGSSLHAPTRRVEKHAGGTVPHNDAEPPVTESGGDIRSSAVYNRTRKVPESSSLSSCYYVPGNTRLYNDKMVLDGRLWWIPAPGTAAGSEHPLKPVENKTSVYDTGTRTLRFVFFEPRVHKVMTDCHPSHMARRFDVIEALTGARPIYKLGLESPFQELFGFVEPVHATSLENWVATEEPHGTYNLLVQLVHAGRELHSENLVMGCITKKTIAFAPDDDGSGGGRMWFRTPDRLEILGSVCTTTDDIPPGYMAPERLHYAPRPCTTQEYMWAAAVTVLLCMTGQPPITDPEQRQAVCSVEDWNLFPMLREYHEQHRNTHTVKALDGMKTTRARKLLTPRHVLRGVHAWSMDGAARQAVVHWIYTSPSLQRRYPKTLALMGERGLNLVRETKRSHYFHTMYRDEKSGLALCRT